MSTPSQRVRSGQAQRLQAAHADVEAITIEIAGELANNGFGAADSKITCQQKDVGPAVVSGHRTLCLFNAYGRVLHLLIVRQRCYRTIAPRVDMAFTAARNGLSAGPRAAAIPQKMV
jgi:hypothetical protein